MTTPEELAAAYAAAWTERVDAKRLALLASCCSPRIRFLQQGWDHDVVGLESLSATIGEFHAGWPDCVDVRVELTAPVDSHHGFGRGGFVGIFVEDRGDGTDFVELGDAVKMET